MDLYQRKDPRSGDLLSPYWYFDAVVNGKRVRRSTKMTKKADAKRVMISVLAAQDVAQPDAKPMTIHEAVLDYLAHRRELGQDTSTADKAMMKSFGLEAWAKAGKHHFPATLAVRDLTNVRITEFVRARLSEGHAANTIRTEIATIRAAVARCEDSPKLKWSLPPRVDKTRWLTEAEWQRVYDELDPYRITAKGITTDRWVQDRIRHRDLFVALSMCGGRWTEVRKLTVDQVMVQGDVVRIKVYGFKTGKERLVAAPPVLADVLLRRQAEAIEAGSQYLFRGLERADLDGTQPIDQCRGISKAMDRAGLNAPHLVEREGKATVHSLRHTFASWLRQAGVELGTLKELLGHANIEQTMRYAHLAPNAAADAAAKVMTGIAGRVVLGAAQPTNSGHSEVTVASWTPRLVSSNRR